MAVGIISEPKSRLSLATGLHAAFAQRVGGQQITPPGEANRRRAMRSIFHLEVSAQRAGDGAEDSSRKQLVDHCHARRVLVVMSGESPARQ